MPDTVIESPVTSPSLGEDRESAIASRILAAAARVQAPPATPPVTPASTSQPAPAPLPGQAAPGGQPPAGSPTPATATPGPASTESAPASAPALLDLDDLDFDEELPPPSLESVTPATVPPVPDNTEKELQDAIAKGIPDEVENAFLRTSRGKRIMESFKRDRELVKSPDEGGIGHIPTIDEIRQGYSSDQQLQAMKHEMVHAPESFVANLFTINPETGVSFIGTPEQTKTVVGNIYGHLMTGLQQTRNPAYGDLLAAYSFPVFKNFLDHQYSVVNMMPQGTSQEKDDKGRMLDMLQLLEWRVMGAARPLNSGASNGAPGMPDPEKEEMRRRLQGYEQTFQRTSQDRVNSIVQAVEVSSKAAALKDINYMFARAGVDKRYDDDIISPHREDLYAKIEASLPSHDPRGWQSYQLQLREAAKGQRDPSEPAQLKQQLFRNALRASPLVRTRLAALVRDAKAASDSTHTALSATQSMTSTNGGQAAPSSVLPATEIVRQPGESTEDFYTRRLMSKVPSSVRQ